MLMFLLMLLLGAPQDDVVTITSSGPREVEGSILRTRDDVVVTYQDIRLETDWIIYNESTQELTAGDQVRFFRDEEQLIGSDLEINLATKTGSITDASGQLGPGFFVSAGRIERLEDGGYRLHDAVITTCDGPRPGWTFSAGLAEIDPQSRVVTRHTVFRFEGVPVFYLPYMVAPTADRQRSTGLLIPSTSTSTTKGRSVRQSFYWAIDRSADAMVTGEYFSKRGPAVAVDFRAVPNASSTINISGFFAADRKGQGGQSARILTYTDFGRGFRGVADMNVVSSFVFRQVYEEGVDLISSPIERSLAFLTNNQRHSSVNILFNRSAIFFPDQPSVSLRKFPTVEFSLPARPVLRTLPVYFDMAGGYTGFARRDSRITTSVFAQRIDLHPSIHIPVLRTGAFEWSHRFGLRETLYTHSLQPEPEHNSLSRFAFDYESSFVGPRFERDFGTWSHILEPSIAYRYVSGAARFHETIVVDDVDLVTDTNEVEYALTNRFMAGHEFLSWRIAQKVYFDRSFGNSIVAERRNVFAPLLDITGFGFADRERHFSPLVSTIRIATSPQTSTDIQVNYDTGLEEFRSAGIIGGLSRGHVFSNLSYFFTKRSATQSPNHQIRGLIGYGNEAKPGLSTALGFSYDIHRSLFQGTTAQVGYNTDCYGLSLEFSQFDLGARNESRFKFALSLKNLGSFGTIRRQERLF